MKRIGLLSDTHGYFDRKIPNFFSHCDEIWHAGDIGSMEVAVQLSAIAPLKAVSGNIDDTRIREMYPQKLFFTCENTKIMILHIGGYPGKYARGVKECLSSESPDVFISGHSHILKVIYDNKLQLLHMNPGAAGMEGIHKQRTLLRFMLEDGLVKKPEIIELGPRF